MSMGRGSHRQADQRGAVARPAIRESVVVLRRLLVAAMSMVAVLALAGPVLGAAPGDPPRDHVWIPSLGIDRAVHVFPCPRQRPPDDLVYAWGCAGDNNVYLMGHAHSVFRPLHDSFVAGRLPPALTVHYADSEGVRRTYRLAWWRLTEPTPDAAWAWAPQDRPSMTLQTCVGPDNEQRLMVRLLEVGTPWWADARVGRQVSAVRQWI